MRIRVLGSSGIHPTADNPASGYLVETAETRLWLDAGTGTFAALQAAEEGILRHLDALVLTHGHADHCLDVLPFHYALRFHPDGPLELPLFAPRDAWERLGAFLAGSGTDDDPPSGDSKLRRTFDFHPLEDGDRIRFGDLSLRFLRTEHQIPTLAVRLENESCSLVYTADTGPMEGLVPLARGADLLLAEATYQDDVQGPPVHLSARQAGELAREAEVRELVLTHVGPGLDPKRSQEEARAEAGEINVSLAKPNRVIQVA